MCWAIRPGRRANALRLRLPAPAEEGRGGRGGVEERQRGRKKAGVEEGRRISRAFGFADRAGASHKKK